jgi:hypothetical protein
VTNVNQRRSLENLCLHKNTPFHVKSLISADFSTSFEINPCIKMAVVRASLSLTACLTNWFIFVHFTSATGLVHVQNQQQQPVHTCSPSCVVCRASYNYSTNWEALTESTVRTAVPGVTPE